MIQIEKALAAVRGELDFATRTYGAMASPHEAYAIILEELDEFKQEVWKKPSKRNRENMRTELIQTAAMCIRALVDLRLEEEVV